MAFTNTPTTSTYDTKQEYLANNLEIRPDSDIYLSATALTYISQGAGLVNMLPYNAEATKSGFTGGTASSKTLSVITRPPINGTTVASVFTLAVYGMYVWRKSSSQTYYFVATLDTVYTATNPLGTWTAALSFTGGVPMNKVGFTEFVNSAGTVSLVMVTGAKGYKWTSNSAVTQITDVDFPANHIPDPIFLDAYLFLADKNTGDIYNSDLDDPTAWTAGSFISSELYPDDIVGLAKINNYLLAIGTQGCEYFYDAANPTASPLQRLDNQSLPFGCIHRGTIAYTKNAVAMLCNSNAGEPILRVVEDLKFTDIPSGTIVSFLNSKIGTRFGSGATTTDYIRGNFIRLNGDLLYVITFKGVSIPVANRTTPTLAFSFNTGMWIELTYDSGPMPIGCACSTNSDQDLVTYVAGVFPSTGYIWFGAFAEINYPSTSQIASDYLDGSTSKPIAVEVRTPIFNFDSLNGKTMYRLGLYGYAHNKASVAANSDYNVSISYSDDDYQTYSSARTLSLKPGTNYPFITQLGAFRQRSFKITYSGVLFWRWERLEFAINKRQQ